MNESELKINGTYLVENDGTMQGMDIENKIYTDKLDINLSGQTPTGGYLEYENSKLKNGCLTFDEYKVTIENGEAKEVEKGSCENQSLTACESPNFNPSPEEWFTFDASTNTITGFDNDEWDGTTDIVIPCEIDSKLVKKVAGFSDKGLTSIVISDSVEIVDYNAFHKNNISSVIIGDNVETIHSGSFSHNLIEELIIPDSVLTIESAFSNNKIGKLKLGKKLEKIDFAAFATNNLKTVVIPSNVKIINASAFAANQLEKVYIYGNDIEIGSAFYKGELSNPNLTSIYNNTGKSFDWGMITSGNSNPTEYVFETGIVENSLGNVEIKKSN